MSALKQPEEILSSLQGFYGGINFCLQCGYDQAYYFEYHQVDTMKECIDRIRQGINTFIANQIPLTRSFELKLVSNGYAYTWKTLTFAKFEHADLFLQVLNS